MFTDLEMQRLIAIPKQITKKEPANGMRQDRRYLRCTLELEAVAPNDEQFTVFIRQSTELIEDFSIGLRLSTEEYPKGGLTLVRYNGAHGEISRSADGHYAASHIHWMTEEELEKGSMEPQENLRELTDKYVTYDEALGVFFNDIGAINYDSYFRWQLSLEISE